MARRLFSTLLWLVLVLPVLAQKQNENQPIEKKPVEAAKPMAMPEGGAPVDPNSYQLGPEDVINIRVWREPELSGTFALRPDGKITLPLAGEVQAGGLTPEQLKKIVVEQYSKFVNKPEVMVGVAAVQSKKFYLVGEVNRPGMYPLVVPTTVLEAINGQGGGLREFANKGKITILRGNQQLKFNYKDVIKGKNMDQNIPVQNGDHIMVP